MSCASVQQLLEAARTAYHNLMVGKSVREIVDQNGERVTFTAANADRLKSYIADLEAQISRGGVTASSRRPAIPYF